MTVLPPLLVLGWNPPTIAAAGIFRLTSSSWLLSSLSSWRRKNASTTIARRRHRDNHRDPRDTPAPRGSLPRDEGHPCHLSPSTTTVPSVVASSSSSSASAAAAGAAAEEGS